MLATQEGRTTQPASIDLHVRVFATSRRRQCWYRRTVRHRAMWSCAIPRDRLRVVAPYGNGMKHSGYPPGLRRLRTGHPADGDPRCPAPRNTNRLPRADPCTQRFAPRRRHGSAAGGIGRGPLAEPEHYNVRRDRARPNAFTAALHPRSSMNERARTGIIGLTVVALVSPCA